MASWTGNTVSLGRIAGSHKKIMLQSTTELQVILQLAPDWAPILDSVRESSKCEKVSAFQLFERLGAKAIYKKALALGEGRKPLMVLIRDHYYQPVLSRMLTSNQNLRRFWSQRRVPPDLQKGQAISVAVELAQKMDGVLGKHLTQQSEDGFKVLLPAYLQRTVHNAVIDHIRDEWQWEHTTLQDMNLDPEQEDPRQNTADDARYAPENRILSGEQVQQLNQLRQQLESLLGNKNYQQEPLVVVDCMFGLGLTENSTVGEEMTMRECCEKLQLAGETQARKIARCQVLLDKGLDMIRQVVREKLPSVAECWQSEINVNSASRRELGHQLGFTESEVDRLIAARQYYALQQLIENAIIKPNKLQDLQKRGAVAAFIPVDLNSATTRDIIDIVGADKEIAQKLVSQRPYEHLSDLVEKKIIDKTSLERFAKRGAVLRSAGPSADRIDLNKALNEEVEKHGVPSAVVQKLVRGRPFSTWAELEDFLCCDGPTWALLRQKFCLGLNAH